MVSSRWSFCAWAAASAFTAISSSFQVQNRPLFVEFCCELVNLWIFCGFVCGIFFGIFAKSGKRIGFGSGIHVMFVDLFGHVWTKNSFCQAWTSQLDLDISYRFLLCFGNGNYLYNCYVWCFLWGNYLGANTRCNVTIIAGVLRG